MKDFEILKAQYELDQELAKLNTNNETSAFVVQGKMTDFTDFSTVEHNGVGGFNGFCCSNDFSRTQVIRRLI